MATTKEKLETINSDFNSQYFDTALKKYGRSVSLVLPQSYDDSLTFYEAINKLMYTLNGEILRAQSAENTIATDQDSLQATVDAIAHAEIATDLITTITVTEANNVYTVTYTTVDGETHEAGTINIPAIPTSVSNIAMTNENGIYTFTQTKTDGTQSAIGTVEVPQNNPVVEIKDTVVEDSTNGFDFHTFTETTEDGTENSIGHFYLAQNQMTGASVNADGNLVLANVDQTGVHTSQTLNVHSTEFKDITSQLTLTDSMSIFTMNYTAYLVANHIVYISISLSNPSSSIVVGNNMEIEIPESYRPKKASAGWVWPLSSLHYLYNNASNIAWFRFSGDGARFYLYSSTAISTTSSIAYEYVIAWVI